MYESDEDEDIFRCGRCKTEFRQLELFLEHKQGCKKAPGDVDKTEETPVAFTVVDGEIKAFEVPELPVSQVPKLI